MEGIDAKKLTDYLTKEAAAQRATALKSGLAGQGFEPKPKTGQDHQHKSAKEIAQDWTDIGTKQSKAISEARD
jgi:hypothetical protein